MNKQDPLNNIDLASKYTYSAAKSGQTGKGLFAKIVPGAMVSLFDGANAKLASVELFLDQLTNSECVTLRNIQRCTSLNILLRRRRQHKVSVRKSNTLIVFLSLYLNTSNKNILTNLLRPLHPTGRIPPTTVFQRLSTSLSLSRCVTLPQCLR